MLPGCPGSSRPSKASSATIFPVEQEEFGTINGKPDDDDFERLTESPVSYESGSNIAGWGEPAEVSRLPLWMRLAVRIVHPFHRGQQDPDDK